MHWDAYALARKASTLWGLFGLAFLGLLNSLSNPEESGIQGQENTNAPEQ
jgi:hypothetical protein